jgi:hypothetical protein
MADLERILIARRKVEEQEITIGIGLGFSADLITTKQLDRGESERAHFISHNAASQISEALISRMRFELGDWQPGHIGRSYVHTQRWQGSSGLRSPPRSISPSAS